MYFMNKNTGFTLIEILIAMLIMAFGLLGLAGLQATGLSNNQRAYHRSQATQLAYDMADRIRANIADAATGGTRTYINTLPTAATQQVDCTQVSATCTTADMAENDLFLWNQVIRATLPLGSGTITANGTVYAITINWDDNRDGLVDANPANAIPDDPNFQMSFQL